MPINGAVVIGKKLDDSIIAQTFSKYDGSFELFSDKQEQIEVVEYYYLNMEAGMKTLTNLGSNPTSVISNETIEIGQIENYSGKNKIITTNFIIKGNGINGGNVTINAPNNITLGSGTKVLKGGVLKVNNAYVLENSLLLVPFSGCNLQQIDDLNSNLYEENKNIHLQLEIKPNPTNGLIQIRNLEIGILNRIQVTDVFGNVIKDVSTDSEQYTLDLTTQPTAMYFLVISNINNQRFFKIIKE